MSQQSALSKSPPFRLFRFTRAYTRIELVAVLASAALILTLMLPALADSNSASERAICFNNLRLIGGAVHGWAADSPQNQPQWWTPVAAGGTAYRPKPGNSWIEFWSLSNYLSRPQIIACPADTGVLPARNWQELFVTRQNSVSYVVGLHAGRDAAEDACLSGDRNLRFDASGYGCGTGVNNAYLVLPYLSGTLVQWTNSVHSHRGHVLLYGGSVEFTETPRLRELLFAPANDENGGIHFLRAR